MRLGIFQILQQCSEIKTYGDRVTFLRNHDNGALRIILQSALDPNIVWDLPDTDPPYKECPYPGQEMRLMSESRRLYLFVRGGNPNLNRVRREALYIELLESIHPEDAKLLNACKNKKIPYKNITLKLVKEAFPNLIEAEGTEENEN